MRLVHVREWPLLALTDGKVIDVLARGANGYVIVRVPADHNVRGFAALDFSVPPSSPTRLSLLRATTS